MPLLVKIEAPRFPVGTQIDLLKLEQTLQSQLGAYSVTRPQVNQQGHRAHISEDPAHKGIHRVHRAGLK